MLTMFLDRCGSYATLFLMLTLLAGCSVGLQAHNEDAAAESAHSFAVLAFENVDLQSAYESIAPEAKSTLSLEKFSSIVRSMLPEGALADCKAYAFEPIPAQSAMYIYLSGSKGANTYYFKFVMVGSGLKGYTVASVVGGTSDPPGTQMKQPLKKS